MFKLCPLWRGVTKNGKQMLSGPIDAGMPLMGGMRVLIFPNEKKEGKQPDFFLFLAAPTDTAETTDTIEPDTPF
ncbi:MAG: hypothetical protein A2W19_01400 [Spirochaetes bacterium RBG_16_49_21]|nr:MAG: hypothetical protein A2W19_01400 [Spirochaetes bacterium RBG_16_49_21]